MERFDSNYIINKVYDGDLELINARQDTNNILNGVFDSSANAIRVNIIGLTSGPQGPIGPQGPQGFTGSTGTTGPQGSAGTIGIDGVTGPTGPAGINYSYSTKTLVQADWVLNAISGYYEQTITLTGILSTSYVEVIAPTNRDYYNDYVDNQILITSVTADTLIFEAIVEPLADIIIEIRYIV